jgi:hypothetical protein
MKKLGTFIVVAAVWLGAATAYAPSASASAEAPASGAANACVAGTFCVDPSVDYWFCDMNQSTTSSDRRGYVCVGVTDDRYPGYLCGVCIGVYPTTTPNAAII